MRGEALFSFLLLLFAAFLLLLPLGGYIYSRYLLTRMVPGKIDELRAKIEEFEEKGINTDELERVLERCEAEMGAMTESEE